VEQSDYGACKSCETKLHDFSPYWNWGLSEQPMVCELDRMIETEGDYIFQTAPAVWNRAITVPARAARRNFMIFSLFVIS